MKTCRSFHTAWTLCRRSRLAGSTERMRWRADLYAPDFCAASSASTPLPPRHCRTTRGRHRPRQARRSPGSPTLIQDRNGVSALYVLMPLRVRAKNARGAPMCDLNSAAQGVLFLFSLGIAVQSLAVAATIPIKWEPIECASCFHQQRAGVAFAPSCHTLWRPKSGPLRMRRHAGWSRPNAERSWTCACAFWCAD